MSAVPSRLVSGAACVLALVAALAAPPAAGDYPREHLYDTAVGPDETIILCPANHSPPTQVAPFPGAPGYEAVATCLASPEVRARTEGVIAWRPEVA